MTSVLERQTRHFLPRASALVMVSAVAGLVAACAGSVEQGSVGSGSENGSATDDDVDVPASSGSDSPSDTQSGPKEANEPQPSGLPGSENAACDIPSPGRAPLRRLSNAEYVNTVTDLFEFVDGIEALVREEVADFPVEPESLGFRNSAKLLTVQSLTAQKYLDAAERVAATAALSEQGFGCASAGDADDSCVRGFVADWGQRVYRRALAESELDAFVAVFEQGQQEQGPGGGVEWVLFTLLQSPQFLYRVEHGAGGIETGAARLSSNEMATRLAYLFWQSTPDQALLSEAEQMDLEAPEQVETLARTMLKDPRSERLFQYFVEWLDLDRLQEFERDPAVFGELPSELPVWLEQETRAFVTNLLAQPDGSFEELLTAPYTYANAGLAEHYGLIEPQGAGFVRVDAPERSGVLTQAALFAHDKPYRTSIVGRGLKVRTDLLCQNVPSPPDDVPLDLGSTAGAQSQRERLEQHRADQACASCHVLLDPIGIALEQFDAVGRLREHDENGQPLDTSSELTATLDADGPIASARQLGAQLAQSKQARDCYVTQTFRFFFGRDAEPADSCSILRMQQAFEDSNHSLSELLIAVTQTDAFRYLNVSPEEQP